AQTAQAHYQNALQIRTRDAAPSDWAMTQHSLGNLFLRRYERSGQDAHAQTAQAHYQNALLVYTRDAAPSHWATVQHSLGNLFLDRYERSGEDAHAQTAQAHYQNALLVYTRDDAPSHWAMTQHSLGNLFLDRYERSGQDAHAQTAQAHYQQVIHLAEEKPLPAVFPFRAATALSRLNFLCRDWQGVLQSAQAAHVPLEELLAMQSESGGSEDWLAEAQGLPIRTAFARLQEQPADPRKAVEALEEGRGQLLREALYRQSAAVERLPSLGFKTLYEDWKKTVEEERRLLNLPFAERHPGWFEDLPAARARVKAVAGEIRQQAGSSYPEFRYFLQSLPFEEIQHQAQDAPLVYLAATPYGGFALIVRAQGEPQAVDLPLLHEQTLRERVLGGGKRRRVPGAYLGAYQHWLNLGKIFPIFQTAWQDELDALLEWLGEAVMAPLLEALSGEERAVLIPGGWLGILPLHAARLPQGGYALDRMTFTYAPGAHALYHARQHQNGNGEHLLAVENPREDLIFTPWEVRAARRYFPGRCTHLRGKKATLQAVEQALPEAGILHFSTHGSAGWGDSQRAALALANSQSLSLKRVYALHLQRAQVAILSACETAVPGLKAPDEVLSLPAGWMLAGVPRVIGSLWAVDDLSTALLITRFYDLWQGAGKPIPEALREAQRWLRDTPPEELRSYCRKYPDREVGQAFHRYLTLFSDSPNFAHPFFWAGFACVGLP
ncbi:MAG: CHAT domain-containing protein, partial [Anaerolinea sp.]